MKFVDVTNDVAFRKIFGNENRKDVLISFLNAVLQLQNKNKIVDVTILTPFQLPEIRGGKVTIVDVKAKDQNQNSYIVEMQIAEIDDFDKRVLYYASKSYSAQIERGDDYKSLKPTFFIGILDFVATQNTNYLSRHRITDITTGENFLKDIEFNFIELPKFVKNINELDSIIDQWVYFIKNVENLDVIPENIKDSGLLHAYEDAAKHNWTKQELEAYDYVLMREQDIRGAISFAERKALEKGMKKGMEKGMEKGIEKGMEKGMENSIEKVIKNSKLSIEDIAEMFEVSIEYVLKIKQAHEI